MSSVCWMLVGMCSLGQVSVLTEHKEALKVLVGRLTSPDPSTREQAAGTILGDVLRWDPIADPFWLSSERRIEASRDALPMLGSLIALLEHADRSVRHAAIAVLAHIGAEARDAIPILSKIARNGDLPSENRYYATIALLYVVPESQSVLGDLSPELGPDLPAMRVAEPGAADGLLATSVALAVPLFAGPLINSGHTKSEVAWLLSVARSGKSRSSRLLAITILGEFGADAKVAVPDLRKLLNDDDSLVRRFATGAILQIDADCRVITRIASREMGSDDDYTEFERAAIKYREQQENERRETIALIVEYPEGLGISLAALRHCSGFHRRRTLRLLAGVGPPARAAIPEIQKLLSDSDPETRQLARDALSRICSRPSADSRCSVRTFGSRLRSAMKTCVRRRRLA